MADDDTNELEPFYDIVEAFLVLMEPYGETDAMTILTLTLGSIIADYAVSRKHADELSDILCKNIAEIIIQAENEGTFMSTEGGVQ